MHWKWSFRIERDCLLGRLKFVKHFRYVGKDFSIVGEVEKLFRTWKIFMMPAPDVKWILFE